MSEVADHVLELLRPLGVVVGSIGIGIVIYGWRKRKLLRGALASLPFFALAYVLLSLKVMKLM